MTQTFACGVPEMRPLASIPQPYRPPKGYVTPGWPEFVADVKKRGILQPLTLALSGNLVDGMRRALAAEINGLTEVPVVTNPAVDTPAKELAFTLATEARSERNPAAHARSMGAFMEQHGVKTGKALAQALELSEAKVSRYLGILKYPDDVIDAVGNLSLSMAHLHAVSKVEDGARKLELLRKAVADPKLTAAALGKLAFPPKKKASKLYKFEAGGVAVTIAPGVDFVTFLTAWAQVKEVIEGRFKELNKRELPVAQVMNNL